MAIFVLEVLLLAALAALLTVFVTKSMLLHSAQAQGPNVEDDPLIAEQTPSPTPEPTLPPYVIPADLTAHAVADTQPENLILETAVEVDGERVENYTPSRSFSFTPSRAGTMTRNRAPLPMTWTRVPKNWGIKAAIVPAIAQPARA